MVMFWAVIEPLINELSLESKKVSTVEISQTFLSGTGLLPAAIFDLSYYNETLA
jgi:hypothetical protein